MLRKDFFARRWRRPLLQPGASVRVTDAVPGVVNKTAPARTPFRVALTGIYLVAAAVGFVLGGRGLLPFGHTPGTSTPLARVGFALGEHNLEAAPGAWAALGADVDTVRAGFAGQERDVLDLVIAVRGLKSAGQSAWSQAEQLCRALKWPRCDRPALEELKARSRP